MLPPSPWLLERLYNQCLWHKLDTVRTTVVIDGCKHHLHRLRIGEHRYYIARMLLLTRKDLHHSVNPKGMPWMAARVWDNGTTLVSLTHVHRVLALGAAAGFVTIDERHLPQVDEKLTYVIVEDSRIRHWLKEERERRREQLKAQS